jgi:hypothetical protein
MVLGECAIVLTASVIQFYKIEGTKFHETRNLSTHQNGRRKRKDS